MITKILAINGSDADQFPNIDQRVRTKSVVISLFHPPIPIR